MAFRFAARRSLARLASASAVAPAARGIVLARSALLARSLQPQRLAASAFSTSIRAASEEQQEQSPAVAPAGSPSGKTVYVGNIYFDSREADLRKHFEQYGPVDNIQVVTDMRGMSRGFAFVHFKDKESAQNALANGNQSVLDGRHLTVKEQIRGPTERTRQRSPPSDTLFVGNMPYTVSDEDMQALFSTLKGIRNVRLAVDRVSGHPRGFAHADFYTTDAAQKAHETLDGYEWQGRTLRVDFARNSVASKAEPAAAEAAESDAPVQPASN